MLEYASDVDEVILMSGDGDFAILLRHIKHKFATRCTVVGVDQLTAFALRQSADEFLPIHQQWLQGS